MRYIFIIVGRIYRYHFKCNYDKPKTFCCFFNAFLESALNLKHFEKNDLYSLSISVIIDFERRGYLNAWKSVVSENPSGVNVLQTEAFRSKQKSSNIYSKS